MNRDQPQKPTEIPPHPRVVDSEDLLRGAKQVIIRHAGVDYRLILTRNDKLILQK